MKYRYTLAAARALGLLTAGLLTLGLLSGKASAENWPGFRGAGADGRTTEKNLPVEWSAKKNVKWKAPIPGRGWSGPIVWGDKIFVTTAVPEKKPIFKKTKPGVAAPPPDVIYRWEVHCLDQNTGKTLWTRVAHRAKPRTPIHKNNTYATETPITDGKRVYAYFGNTGVFCYDFEGKLIWKKDLGAYPMWAGWGTSSAPALHDGLLFVQDDNEKQSFLVALESDTGKERWRVERKEESTYATPIIWKNSKRAELIVAGLIYRSYEPATGKVLWSLDMQGGRSTASPVADGDVLYVGNDDRSKSPFKRPGRGDGGVMFAVRAGASGDITPEKGQSTSPGVIWSQKGAAPEMASPVLYEGFLYMVSRGGGNIRCVDSKTGQIVYSDRLAGAGNFWASPWAYQGKIFCLDAFGTTFVVNAGPKFEVERNNSVDETCWACPAISDGCLLIRGDNHLYCITKP